MIDELNKAIEEYQVKWDKLIEERSDKAFFQALKPTAVGWKVVNRAEYDQMCAELHDQTDQIIETWMNGRWIAKLHLKDAKLSNGIEIIKIMQRRSSSADAVGLDHLDFYSPNVVNGEEILTKEPGLKWTRENNDVIEGYDWLSIWFDGTEAKLKSDTVIDIIIAELDILNKRLKD